MNGSKWMVHFLFFVGIENDQPANRVINIL